MATDARLVSPSDMVLSVTEHPPESRNTGVGADIRHAFALAKQYFAADPWVGGILLVLGLGLGAVSSVLFVQVTVALSKVTTALAEHDGGVIPGLLTTMVTFAIAAILLNLAEDWAKYVLRMRARTVLTARLLTRWLGNNRFYRLERTAKLDHPEQRIQEDVYSYIESMLSLVPSIIISLIPLTMYSAQLWKLSPPVVIAGVTIQGYMLFMTIALAIGWTIVTHFIGRSLTRAEIVRQRLEAQFRQDMAGVRENGEAIAFQRGADTEQQRVLGTFDLIRRNWRFYTFSNLRVTFATGIPSIFFIVGPTLLCAPFVLSGQMKVGDITLVGAALIAVYSAVGVFVQSYRSLAILRSAVSRLRFFDELLDQDDPSGIEVRDETTARITTDGLILAYPNGRTMAQIGDLTLTPGTRLLIKGESGAGKSTLLRALAGLWPHGVGKVSYPAASRVLFLPQTSYMPDGTLASLMAYPRDPGTVTDADYADLLDRLGLSHLAPHLHHFTSWRRVLSPGEQQRVAGARAILNNPEFLFVDEATSALDLHSETNFYALLGERLPNAAIISVAHRPTVEKFHTMAMQIAEGTATVTAIPQNARQ